MVIFPLAPDQTIAQTWSNGARGGKPTRHHLRHTDTRSSANSLSRFRQSSQLDTLT